MNAISMRAMNVILRSMILRNNLLRTTVTRKVIAYMPSGRTFCNRRCCLSRNGILHANKMPLQILRGYADYPKHALINLPSLSPTMEVGKIASWSKKEGDKIAEGDVIAEIETDKATAPFEASDEGYLAKILVQAGTEAPVGSLICIMVENEADVAAFKDYKAVAAAPAPAAAAPAPAAAAPPPAAPAAAAAPPPAASPPASGQGRVYASPMAKNLAEKRQIRLQGKGSGMYGSIKSTDLDKMSSQPAPSPGAAPPRASAAAPAAASQAPRMPAGATFVDIPVTGMRAVIAKRLLESKTTIPHYYLSAHIDVTQLLQFRVNFNKKSGKGGPRISVNDFIIKACACASTRVPSVNATWLGKTIRQYKNVDVSVAVSTDKGLITPIVFEANNKGLLEISQNVKDLAVKARTGKLLAAEYQGGTLTVSNLGMYGVDMFAAIVNPPQSAILAVGTTQSKLVATGKGGFKEISFISATVSADHRIVDGAVGAEWLQVFRDCLSEPAAMLL